MPLDESYFVIEVVQSVFVYQKHIRTITMIDRKFIASSNSNPNTVITCGGFNDLFVVEGE